MSLERVKLGSRQFEFGTQIARGKY